jgi:DNA ligase 1
MIKVQYDRGIFLPDLDLWLDPWDERAVAFVSHAHSDHIGNHREVLLSQVTARLMAARLPGDRIEHAFAFGQPFVFRGAEGLLYPAGHIFGSAQLFLARNGSSLLYTGDFKLRPGQSAEPIEWTQADTLIMETTYGLPQFVFPPTAEVITDLQRFCAETFEEDAIPILFGYSLGKAQEILAALKGCGWRILLHPSVYRLTKLFEEMQQRLPKYEVYAGQRTPGSVLICPPGANRTRMVQEIRHRRTAVLTGWALNPGATFRYQCDAAFPLSDHADYADLLRYVELVKPLQVLTVHGFAREFAADLRHRGVEAWALAEDNQLELSLLHPPIIHRAPTITEPPNDEVESGFGQFARIADQISKLTGKLKKIQILADYFRSLSEDELTVASVFLTGQAFPRSAESVLQVGWAVIRRALRQASGLDETRFRRIATGYADAGRIAFEVLLERTRGNLSLSEVREAFAQIQSAAGPVAKADLLTTLLRQLSPLSSSYIIRILTGDLRIGLKEGLVEEAIAAAFNSNLDEVKEANMLTGDIGQTAQLAKGGQLRQASVTLFRPLRSMLAVPEPSADSAWERIKRDLDGRPVYAERKYDGIRAQLHAANHRVAIYSRDLRDLSREFPELVRPEFSRSVILDGEILAYREGGKLTFFDLQRRLGRKKSLDLFETSDVPVIYVAFDLLWLDQESLVKQPLRRRRSLLEQLSLPTFVRRSEVVSVGNAQEIRDAFILARQTGAEGLMVKDPDSLYTPGRRGASWMKLKEELATLDVVVVGAELGHGKRSHVLSDYTFAIRNEESGLLETIGKAYSGLTDAEIEQLTGRFEKSTLRRLGRYREVQPEVVLEVAFDSIQVSKRHSSGLALRFPRIKRIREDKSVKEIDTLAHAQALAGLGMEKEELSL